MSRGLPILTYHSIDASGSVISTDPAWFAATLAEFCANGFRSVDLTDWVDRGCPDVDRGFAICFDDGFRSTLRAAEILSRHGFAATAFLVTDRMGGDNAWPGQPRGIPRSDLLSWSEADDLRSAGIRLAAHTRTHPRLDRLDPAAIDAELRGSREAIEDRTGEPCRLLAYPYGNHDRRVRRIASRHFAAAFGTRLDRASREQHRYAMARIDAYEIRTPSALEALLSGRERARFGLRRTARGTRRLLARMAPCASSFVHATPGSSESMSRYSHALPDGSPHPREHD